MKKIKWEGTSKEDLCGFSVNAKKRAGYELMSVQYGEEPSDWKPMKAIGSGVKEIRIHINKEYRIIYIAKLKDAIHVLHAFTKKTQKTSQKDINIAKERYKDLLKEYRG